MPQSEAALRTGGPRFPSRYVQQYNASAQGASSAQEFGAGLALRTGVNNTNRNLETSGGTDETFYNRYCTVINFSA